ncbi:MAG: RagB/SusD family nutrient uptake outer membrane protein [Rikenellaceae bacterium]
MKNILKLLLLAIVGCGATSCQDFLYPEPTDTLVDETYYTTDAQVQTALTSIYATLRSSQLGTTYLFTMMGYTDEDIHYNSSDDRVGDYSAISTNSTVLSFWTALYAPLKDIAYLLDGLERNVDNLSESTYKHVKGEALFLRGYFHFLLAQWFCHPDVGIPMSIDKITTYEQTMMELSSLDDFYVQIIEDMEAAEVLLEDQTWASLGYSERVTLNAVRGILARVCLSGAGFPNYGLYKGETDPEFYYKKALSKALLVTEMGHELCSEYSEVFIAEVEDRYVSENIWEIGYNYTGDSDSDTNTAGGIGTQSVMGMGRRAEDPETGDYLYDSVLVWNSYRYCNPTLYITYGHGDTRRMWNYPNFTYEQNSLNKIPKTLITSICSESAMGLSHYESGTLPTSFLWAASGGKWRREYEDRITRDQNSSTTNFPLLRYSDVLLMVAEAYIELGEPAMAAPYINQVRERSIPYTSSTKIVNRILVDNSSSYNKGWAHTPVINVIDPGSGTGFEFMTEASLYSDNGLLTIGITEPGSGYTTPPTLEAEAPYQTWAANTSYKINDYVSVVDGTTVRIYQALTAGTSTSVAPSFTITALTETTSPTYDDAKAEQGIAWDYLTAGTTAVPTLTVETIDSDVADVSYHVNISDQDAMREFLRDERMRELCFEGLRRLDLRRWGTLYDVVKGYDELREGGVVGVPLTTGSTGMSNVAGYMADYKMYLPIPLTQISLNRNLIQNPGY